MLKEWQWVGEEGGIPDANTFWSVLGRKENVVLRGGGGGGEELGGVYLLLTHFGPSLGARRTWSWMGGVGGGRSGAEWVGWVGGGVGGWGGIPVANTFWSVLGGKENVELNGWGGWGEEWVGGGVYLLLTRFGLSLGARRTWSPWCWSWGVRGERRPTPCLPGWTPCGVGSAASRPLSTSHLTPTTRPWWSWPLRSVCRTRWGLALAGGGRGGDDDDEWRWWCEGVSHNPFWVWWLKMFLFGMRTKLSVRCTPSSLFFHPVV